MSHMEPAANLYQPASAELLPDEQTRPGVPALFDFSGRLSLPWFLLWHFGLVVLLPYALVVGVLFCSERDWALATALLVTIAPLNLLLSLSLLVRRARDLGLNGAWGVAAFALPLAGLAIAPMMFWWGEFNLFLAILALFLPVLGALLNLLLMVWPGKPLLNRHGPANIALPLAHRVVLGAVLAVVLGGLVTSLVYLQKLAPLMGEFQGWLQRLL